MKRKLLFAIVVLLCSVGTWAYTGVEPAAGRTYFLYNVGANAYFVGTSTAYSTDGNIANATPVTVEASGSNFKLAFVDGGTTYRIYHKDGTRECGNITGVEFWKTGDANGYKLVSKNTDKNRYMNNGGWFGDSSKDNNTSWQFIACEEAMTYMSTFCARVAGANYVQSTKGWERVTSISELQTNPEDYFFAIFSANAVGLIVDASSNNAEPSRPYYKTATDPLSSSQYLFEIENYEPDGFALKSCGLNNYFGNNSDSWNFQNPSEKEANCKLTITLNDGAYRIQSANADWEGRRYWGLYDYTGYTKGQKFAGNKNDAEKGSFLIYRIAKDNLNMTSRITNPTFDSNTSGWIATGEFQNKGLANNQTGDFTENFWENWNGSAKANKMYQNLTNLPNGFYKVKIAAFVNILAENNSSQYVFANDDKTYLVTTSPKFYEVWTEVTDNTLSIGLEQTSTTANWMGIDNVSLTYSSSLPESLTSITGKMNAAVEAAQTSAVETYAANHTVANINAAMKAKAAAEVSKAAYANAANYLESVEAVLATTNFYTPTAYNSVYGTYKTAYDAGTLDDATAAGLTYKVAGSGGIDRYTNNTANDLLIPGWTIGDNNATTTNSGFYINTWSTEDNSNGFANPFYEYWVGSGSLSETALVGTVSGLTPNATYAVTSNVRVQGSDKVANSVRMQVGSGTPVDVTQGNQIGSTSRYVKSYTAVGSTDGSGNLTLTFTVAANSNISWLSFRDINYELRASDEQKTALANAITNAEGKPLGFEDGEYAPYDNISVLEALAAATALDANSATAEEVVAATKSIADSEWTANDGKVNAVYNGDFALSENNGAMAGWVTDHSAGLGGALHARAFVLNSGDGNYNNLAAFGQGDGTRSCAYFRFDGTNSAKTTKYTYGSTIGYTMPLKTGTVYKLTAQAGGWGQVGRAFKMDVVNSSDASLVAQTLTTPATGVHEGGPVIDYEMYFVVPANGNYKLVLSNTSGADNAVAVSNIELFSTDALILAENTTYAAGTYPSVTLNRTFASTDRWYTLCAPFAFSKDKFEEVKVLNEVVGEGESAHMKFVNAEKTVAAGTPCLVKPASANATLTATNVAMPLATTAQTVTVDGINFIGTFSQVNLTSANSNAWVVSNNNLYNVNSDVTVGAYRAYFTVTSSPVKALSFDFGDADAINTIANGQQPIANGPIYNLAGQKMSKLQKGVNIVNGKKVLVK